MTETVTLALDRLCVMRARRALEGAPAPCDVIPWTPAREAQFQWLLAQERAMLDEQTEGKTTDA